MARATVKERGEVDPTIAAEFDVDTREWLQALKAVFPHSSSIRFDYVLGRVRVWFDCDADRLIVAGTDRATVGMAYVTVIAHRSGGKAGVFDLTRSQVQDILAVLKTKPVKEQDRGGQRYRITLATGEVTIREVSDLADLVGKSLTVPRQPLVKMATDMAELMAFALTSTREPVDMTLINGARLARFRQASEAYGAPLATTPTGYSSAIIVSCGELFTGVVFPDASEPADRADVDRWRKDWTKVLPTARRDLLALVIDEPLPAKGGRGTDTTDSPEGDPDTGGSPTG